MERRTRNAADTRQRLIGAACRAFATAGYQRAALRDIAADAGVNFALVQRYFGGKEGLFEQALRSVLDPTLLFPKDRSGFGRHVAALLTSGSVDPFRMMLGALNNAQAANIAQRLLDEHIHAPLASWLGMPASAERATRILMLCSGFVTHWRLLPLDSAESATMTVWLESGLQAIVDEG